MPAICGYMVVRLPERAEGSFAERLAPLDGKIYRGIDRLPWEDLDLGYYDGRLTDIKLAELHKKLMKDSGNVGIGLLRNVEDAVAVLAVDPSASEIIAVYSPILARMIGERERSEVGTRLGFEAFVLGEFSLHSAMFQTPGLFSELVSRMNVGGLFDSVEDCYRLAARYLELSTDERVEPLGEHPGIITLDVFHVGIS